MTRFRIWDFAYENNFPHYTFDNSQWEFALINFGIWIWGFPMRISPLHIWHSIFLIKIWEMTLFVISQYILLWYNFRILNLTIFQWEFPPLTISHFEMRISNEDNFQWEFHHLTFDNFGMTIWDFRMKTIFPFDIWQFSYENFALIISEFENDKISHFEFPNDHLRFSHRVWM